MLEAAASKLPRVYLVHDSVQVHYYTFIAFQGFARYNTTASIFHNITAHQ